MSLVNMLNPKLLLLPALLLAALTPGRGQGCFVNANGTREFRVYDAATRQEVTALCVGNRYRLKDVSDQLTSPQIIPPSRIYYLTGPAITCAAGTDTTTFYTPATAGPVVITQNTPNLTNPASGIIYSRTFEVLARPRPTFALLACSPGVVQVSIDYAKDSYNTYQVQVGTLTDNVPRGAAPRSYPAAAGVTSVTVTGAYTGSCASEPTAQSFTPKPAPLTPAIQRLDRQGPSFVLQFGPLQPEYTYTLQQTDAPAPDVRLSPGQTTLTLPVPAAANGCYRLLLTDACSPSLLSVPSATLCSVLLTGTSANGRNLLSWPPNGATSYVLRRDGVVLPGATSPYVDSVGIVCGVSYRYRLEATTGSGPTAGVATSEAVVLTSALRTQPVPALFVSFNARNQPELTASVPGLPTGGQLIYQRDNTLTIATTARRTTRDSTLTAPTGPVCYTVRFADACGNQSAASPAFCPVFLTAKAADPEGTRAQLAWTALGSPAPAAAVRYTVEAQLADGTWRAVSAALAALDFLDLQPAADRQVLRYRVAARAPGQPVSYSNTATVARQLKLFLPTAFSPNGDGLNDVLELKGRFLTTFRFSVVDRNGQEVFRAADRTQTWNGRIGNEQPVPGAYVWRFEATDETGLRIVQHGTITIVR
ncbi:gliding motility-associated C-terminal domain-containing protein [Hymenobacter daecheongensis DSM 21074]|uniref:Gliding motility-associated C-terminal domain-containing protein n=2 Tax=Hymenobacter daecheongensis TaxID=496053 RepID=A0A1M6EEX7_9BACT|nr:gliding motility-associated C-terminal domain-containing protein [Hymenobacter daecheongensis DSM 21074]